MSFSPRGRTYLLTAFALLLTGMGCKSAPPPAPPPAAAAAPAKAAAAQTDDQLVRAHTSEGLGLGLRVDGTTFSAGKQIPMAVLLEDFSASIPIASGMCTGFSLTYTELTTHDSATSEIDNPHCFATVPFPDEVPLTPGKLKIVEISQRNASNMVLPPGTYDLTLTWNALPAGKGTIHERTTYATLHSNPVQIIVKP